jgi:hypothetical protein
MASRQIYKRYDEFLINGQQTVVPFVKIPNKSTDKRHIYLVDQSRLDKISQQYYGSPTFGWLILMANPQYGGTEWNIPEGSVLTIPYPLITSLQDYKNELDLYFYYYGK